MQWLETRQIGRLRDHFIAMDVAKLIDTARRWPFRSETRVVGPLQRCSTLLLDTGCMSMASLSLGFSSRTTCVESHQQLGGASLGFMSGFVAELHRLEDTFLSSTLVLEHLVGCDFFWSILVTGD